MARRTTPVPVPMHDPNDPLGPTPEIRAQLLDCYRLLADLGREKRERAARERDEARHHG